MGLRVTYQWYQSPDQGLWMPVSGQTSSNLTFTSTLVNAGPYFEAVATDSYGSSTSAVAMVTVYQGVPQLVLNLPGTNYVGIATMTSMQVSAFGSAPLTYQWSVSSDKVNFAPLTDDARITGSQSDTLVIRDIQLTDSAYYKVHVTSGSGGADSTAEFLAVLGRPTFTDNGAGWGLNGSATAPVISNNSLPLTYAAGSSARTAFSKAPTYIGHFYASWTYQDVGSGGADGYTFCMQNDSRGSAALGGAGGSMGVSGITPSAALEFNIYNGGTIGMSFGLNGAIGAMSSTSPVNVAGGNPINTVFIYDGAVAHVTLTDTVTLSTYTTNMNIGSLTTQLGKDTAYVGFTGGDGGVVSTQNVSDFVFYPITSVDAQVTVPTPSC